MRADKIFSECFFYVKLKEFVVENIFISLINYNLILLNYFLLLNFLSSEFNSKFYGCIVKC